MLRNPYGIERDINRSGLHHDSIEVAFHGLFVERIDFCRYGCRPDPAPLSMRVVAARPLASQGN